MGEKFEVGDVVEMTSGFEEAGVQVYWKVDEVHVDAWTVRLSSPGRGCRTVPAGSIARAPAGQRATNDYAARPNSPRRLYLANPYGFSPSLKEDALPVLVTVLESLGYDVVEPFASCASIDLGRPGWQSAVSAKCLADIDSSDCVLAVVNGEPPDVGVAVEVGYAYAKGKPVFLFRDDLRRCSDSEEFPANLMFLGDRTLEQVLANTYTSLASLTDPKRSLAQFAAGRIFLYSSEPGPPEASKGLSPMYARGFADGVDAAAQVVRTGDEGTCDVDVCDAIVGKILAIEVPR